MFIRQPTINLITVWTHTPFETIRNEFAHSRWVRWNAHRMFGCSVKCLVECLAECSTRCPVKCYTEIFTRMFGCALSSPVLEVHEHRRTDVGRNEFGKHAALYAVGGLFAWWSPLVAFDFTVSVNLTPPSLHLAFVNLVVNLVVNLLLSSIKAIKCPQFRRQSQPAHT